MRSLRRAATFVLLAAPLALSPALASPAASHAWVSLAGAVSSFDPVRIQKARALLEAQSAADPGDASLQYRVSYADWRLVPLMRVNDRAKAERYLKDGLERCDRALELSPNHADAMALKGGLLGLAIGFDPKSVQTLGLQARMNLHRAAGLEPSNPRIWLLEGIQVLHTPAQFGGGPARADSVFLKAIALYAGTPADSAAPDWGRDDAYLWAGQCASQLEDWTRARDLYREALRVNPDNAWVRGTLLPGAEKALKAQP